MRRFTNKAIDWKGNTVVLSIRVPKPVADEIDKRVGQEGLPNRSAIAQDALARWLLMEEERDAATDGNGAGLA